MVRKLSVIFTLSIIVAYFILLGLLGEEGFLHARSTRHELEVLKQRQELLLLQVNSLEQQKKHMSSQDALKDAAFRFGYQEEGEQVFYFSNDDDTLRTQQGQTSLSPVKKNTFSGFAKPWVALIALAFSLLNTVLWAIVSKRRGRNR